MQDKLSEILDRLFQDSEYKLIELVIRGEKNTKVLEIYVDSRENLDIDRLSELNRKIDDTLEKDDEFKFSKIVVSSPGIDRSFKYHWQLFKHVGRDMEIEFNDADKNVFCGKLIKVDDDMNLELEELQKGKKGNLQLTGNNRKINFSEIKNSKVLISFKTKI